MFQILNLALLDENKKIMSKQINLYPTVNDLLIARMYAIDELY
jgi:hypothetical protein